MKMNKKLKIFITIILVISFVQFVQPPSMGKDLVTQSDVEKFMKDGVVLYVGSNIAYVNNVRSNIDVGNQNIYPLIKNEKALVPLRFLSENLGFKVDWNQDTQVITLTKDNKVITLKVGDNKMTVDGKEVKLDAAPELNSERVFVPLRPITEALGKKIFWDRGLIIVSDKTKSVSITKKKEIVDQIIAKVNVLPTVDSQKNLKTLLERLQTNNRYTMYDTFNSAVMKSADMTTTTGTSQAANAKAESSADYSKTNVQVEGVDEGDVVKNDGQYIYQVNGQQVVIIKAYPVEEMKVVSKLSFDDKRFSPVEMYVDDKKLVVIGNTYKEVQTQNEVIPNTSVNKKVSIMPYYYNPSKTYTKAVIFDAADKANLKKTREIEIEGSYLSSRKIGSSLYMVADKYVNVYNIENQKDIMPFYRDTNVKEDYIGIDYKCIHYFPGFSQPNYMIVAGASLDENKPVNVYTYLGAGNNIYASTSNLYVASQKYSYETVSTSTATNGIVKDYVGTTSKVTTDVYKFALNQGDVAYKGKGEVPGTILNQFSMDENNNHFRIATTVGEVWRSDKNTSRNNVYVLDNNLTVVGKIEDIAPGEKIYSTRFMGDRLYMVTFKKVDPLFVIDLKDPINPQILGKLKIPGYSDYLHPYDENHIIGFGKDAVEAKQGSFAWYQGLKVAMFDVTDVNNPVEMFKENIGDRGTDSELLTNHKALLFSKDKNLMAFPVNLMTIKGENKIDENGYPKYGTFEFQGEYVYTVDLTGFKLRGRITHMTEDQIKKSGDYWYDGYSRVERAVYIGDVIYTLSQGIIKANDLNTLSELKKVTITEKSNNNQPDVLY